MISKFQKSKEPGRRRVGAVLVLLLALAGIVWAQESMTGETPAAKLQQTFLEASQAYDANRPSDAAALYGKLVDQGYKSKELYFNLGNACFKIGRTGLAVLNYRRAWQIAPRDPDIQANLRFALQSTSALTPEYSTATRLFFKFSLSEWIALATFSYWASASVLALFLVMRNHRAGLSRALTPLILLLVLGAAGIANGYLTRRAPELVVTEPRQQALYAPLEGSKAYFALPEGSIVRLEERSGTWLKVTTGQQSGYVQSKACTPVDLR
jgi:tetratricopeptide (TPR) repeat protein